MTEPPAHENGRASPALAGRAAFCFEGIRPTLSGTGKAITELPLQFLANAFERIRAYEFNVR